MAFWVTFKDGERGCIHSRTVALAEQEAASIKGKPVEKVESLPYGAHPSIDEASFGDFCIHPNFCAGRSSCPRNYACSE
jgi:hypothetical protein